MRDAKIFWDSSFEIQGICSFFTLAYTQNPSIENTRTARPSITDPTFLRKIQKKNLNLFRNSSPTKQLML